MQEVINYNGKKVILIKEEIGDCGDCVFYSTEGACNASDLDCFSGHYEEYDESQGKKLKIKKVGTNVKTPTYATDGSACFDIYPIVNDNESYSLSTSCKSLRIKTGLHFEIPKGKAMLVFSRSGQGFNHDTRLANCVGVIDSDYRGELKLKLRMDDNNYLEIDPEKAIAQALLVDAEQVQFEVVEELGYTERGTGGFGSTDKGKAY